MTTLLVMSDSLAPTDGVGQLARGFLRAWASADAALRFDVRLARDHALQEPDFDTGLAERISIRADLPPKAFGGATNRLALWLMHARYPAWKARCAETPAAIVCWKEYPWAALAAHWAQRLQIPFVQFAHGTYAVRALQQRAQREQALRVHRAARATFAVSTWVANKMRAIAAVPGLEVLPNGIDLALFAEHEEPRRSPAPCGSSPYVITIAGAKERKGLHLAAEVWRHFAAMVPDWHWIIVGEEHLGERYGAALSAELFELPRVHRVAVLDEGTKRQWLREARLHLFTPLAASDGAFEGFGLSFLEAAACGTFSIGTQSCGAAYHVGPELAEFLEPRVDVLVEALRREAALGPAHLRSRQQGMLRAVQQHDLSAAAMRVLEVLAIPLARRGSRA